MMTPLLMRRTRGLAGPAFQRCCPGTLAHGVGNFYGAGGAGSGPAPLFAVTQDATHVRVVFTSCVQIAIVGQIEIQVDGGSWTAATSATGSGVTWDFLVPTMVAGQDIRIRASDTALTDCAVPPNPVDAWEIPVDNTLVLAGNYLMLETGGADIFLLEDATAEDGLQLENAT